MIRKGILLTALVLSITLTATAQTPQKPTVPQPSAEQKARIVEAAKAWEIKQREADTAKDKYAIVLLNTLAELGLKPSETSVRFDDKGEPSFQRIEQAKTPAKSVPPKPED